MRIFLAGATGAIGRRLVPMLLDEGHEVTGASRSPERAAALDAAGAHGVACDALDAKAVRETLEQVRPEAVIHELTSIPAAIDPRTMERDFELNDRLRSEGTRILVDAAQAVGAQRIVAQSIAFSYRPGRAGTIHDEQDPLIAGAEAARPYARSAEAVRALEKTVLAAGGIVLRYGYFYGPGTAIVRDGSTGEAVKARRLPVIGGGHGVWSFVHIDDAAAATVAALDRGTPASAYNIVDDAPAEAREWIPALAEALGARPPLRLPAWLARPLAGAYGVQVMTKAQGASGARARQELGWTPAHPSWREGFETGL